MSRIVTLSSQADVAAIREVTRHHRELARVLAAERDRARREADRLRAAIHAMQVALSSSMADATDADELRRAADHAHRIGAAALAVR